jgi:O-antigen/teichoic acid export membrane protein
MRQKVKQLRARAILSQRAGPRQAARWYYDLLSMGVVGTSKRYGLSFLATPVPLLAVAVGLSALAGYGFIASVGHSVDAPNAAALSGLYFMVNIVALGAFSGLEQETTRAVSRAVASGGSQGPVIRRQLGHGAVMVLGGLGVIGVCSVPLVGHELHGHWDLVWALGLAVVGAGAGSLVRGMLSGNQRFRLYAVELAVEGIARLLPSVALWLFGVTTAWSFGVVFAGAPALAALTGWLALRASRGASTSRAGSPPVAESYEPVAGTRAVTNLGLLVVGNLVGQFVTNGTPLVIAPRLATVSGAALGTAINAAIVLTRTPLFALFPIQSLVLPKLTAAVTRGDLAEVRNRMALLVAYCGSIGLVGSAGFALLGQWVLRTFMGIDSSLAGGMLAVLGLGTTCLMAALVLQDALVALDRHRVVLFAWSAGAAAMIVVFLLPVGAVAATAAASLFGPLAVACVMAAVVRDGTRSRRATNLASTNRRPGEVVSTQTAS